MEPKKRRVLLIWFLTFCALALVWYVLSRVSAPETTFWMVKTLLSARLFQNLTVGTKLTTPQERPWKTGPENGVFSWVPFCLRSLGPFERCTKFDFFQYFTSMPFANIYMALTPPPLQASIEISETHCSPQVLTLFVHSPTTRNA